MTENELAHIREDSDLCGPVTHDEAHDHLLRFTHKAFGRSGSMPVLSIPADPRRDSDLRMGAYIHQNRKQQALSEWRGARITTLEAAVRGLLDAIHDSMTHESQRHHAAEIEAARKAIQ